MKRLIPLLLLVLAAPGFAPSQSAVAALRSSAQAHALGVSINGPTTVQSGHPTTWEAVVTGGTPPYQYAWMHTVGGDGMPDGATWEGSFDQSGILHVGVQDARGATGQATVYVMVAPCCP
jgi:hypothetical protein